MSLTETHAIGESLGPEFHPPIPLRRIWATKRGGNEADRRELMSDERFSVDGMLIEAAASIKSFRRRNDDDDADDHGSGAARTEDFRGRS